MTSRKRALPHSAWLAGMAAALLLASAGIAAAADPPPLGKPEIVYAHTTWSSGRVLYELGRKLLEKAGYKVTDKVLDTGIIYASLASGQVDLFSSSWLPGQQPYLNKYGDKVDIVSASIVPVPGGLMVPSYVAVNSIEDLAKDGVAKEFGDKIVGIDAGAGIMLSTKKAIAGYKLPMQLEPSSDAAMSAAFKAAYQQKKPIVITGWCPHILCAIYGVKFLADPKGVYGKDIDYNIVRPGFRQDHPRAAELLARFTLSDKQISQMLAWVDVQKMTDDQAIDRFMKENAVQIYYMLRGLAPDLQKPANLD